MKRRQPPPTPSWGREPSSELPLCHCLHANNALMNLFPQKMIHLNIPPLTPKPKTFSCSAIAFLDHPRVCGTPESCVPASGLSWFVQLIGHCHGVHSPQPQNGATNSCHERSRAPSGAQSCTVSGCPRELRRRHGEAATHPSAYHPTHSPTQPTASPGLGRPQIEDT